MHKIYFPNLNGLRFLAALLVIIHHIEQVKLILGVDNYWSVPFFPVIGKLGVVLFFVLSGFLITYLLLAEEKQTNTIYIKDFYIRRILRIWPVYYLVVMLSFFLFSRISFLSLGDLSTTLFSHLEIKFLFFLLFLPNLANMLFYPIPYAFQTWSVGVEEQFYLIWPVLMKKFRNKELLLYSVLSGYLFIKLNLMIIKEYAVFWNKYLQIFADLWATFSIDCMAIGGLFAIYLFREDKILKIIFHRYLQGAVWVSLLILIGYGITVPFIHYEFYAVLFGILILNLAANKNTLISFENKVFHYLGKISYGLYMYHMLGIVIAFKGLKALGINNIVLLYLASMLLTVIISGLSYSYFERFFIKKKIRFSKVISGDNSK